MRSSCSQRSLAIAAALSLAALVHPPALAQSTAFTYQGSLDDASAAASGLHDFRFRLYDAVSGGVQIGSTLCVDNVSVVAGVFTTQLDFGQQFATTAQRHLEIEVRRDTGLTCANGSGFVVMAPRQQLTATPMASHANAAFALDAADGSPTNAVFVDDGGNVGIGTTSPGALLHLQRNVPVIFLQDTASPSNQAGYVSFRNSASIETGWVGYGTTGSPQFSVVNARTGGDLRLYTGTGGDINLTPGAGGDVNLVGGNVGVGTFTPAATLDVRGDIRLGSSGQYRATAGEENLRIIRGIIAENGSLSEGTGFSVSHPETGRYIVTFTTPFAGVPTITASADRVPFTPGGAGSTAVHCVMTDFVTASRSELVTSNVAGGVWQDRTFQFIAIGPR